MSAGHMRPGEFLDIAEEANGIILDPLDISPSITHNIMNWRRRAVIHLLDQMGLEITEGGTEDWFWFSPKDEWHPYSAARGHAMIAKFWPLQDLSMSMEHRRSLFYKFATECIDNAT